MTGNTVDNSDGHGILIGTATEGLTISSNTVTNNMLDGLRVNDYSGSIVAGGINNNVATGNGGTGIRLDVIDGGRIDDNQASNNGQDGFLFGTWTSGTFADGNIANNNGDAGFRWLQSIPNGLFDNGTANGNGSDGFVIPSISNGFFRNNSADNNVGAGFNIGSTFGIIRDNTATGNADNSLP